MVCNIKCQCCGKELPSNWFWYRCDTCNYRVCQECLSRHKGQFSSGGFKCSQCLHGQMKHP